MEGRPVNSSANSPHNSRLATKRNSSATITATEAVKGILHVQETTYRFSYIILPTDLSKYIHISIIFKGILVVVFAVTLYLMEQIL